MQTGLLNSLGPPDNLRQGAPYLPPFVLPVVHMFYGVMTVLDLGRLFNQYYYGESQIENPLLEDGQKLNPRDIFPKIALSCDLFAYLNLLYLTGTLMASRVIFFLSQSALQGSYLVLYGTGLYVNCAHIIHLLFQDEEVLEILVGQDFKTATVHLMSSFFSLGWAALSLLSVLGIGGFALLEFLFFMLSFGFYFLGLYYDHSHYFENFQIATN